MVLLVRNRVQDADAWKRVFDRQTAVGAAAGLTVLHVWRSVDAPDQVFFLLGVEDRARAEAFMASPESAAVGVEGRRARRRGPLPRGVPAVVLGLHVLRPGVGAEPASAGRAFSDCPAVRGRGGRPGRPPDAGTQAVAGRCDVAVHRWRGHRRARLLHRLHRGAGGGVDRRTRDARRRAHGPGVRRDVAVRLLRIAAPRDVVHSEAAASAANRRFRRRPSSGSPPSCRPCCTGPGWSSNRGSGSGPSPSPRRRRRATRRQEPET